MPSRFDTLTQAQKDAFNDRVQQLGFDPKAIAGSHIVTGGGGLRIHGAAAEFANHVKYKTISSIDELKRLLGVPDAAFKKGTPEHHLKYLPPPTYSAKPAVTLLALTEPERNDLEAATYAYLFGDSSKVAAWRDTIDRLLLPREVSFVAVENVTVTPSNPLIIRNPSYTFGTVTIEPGGEIIVESDSSVHAQLLVKES
jgi:hypothetical protein